VSLYVATILITFGIHQNAIAQADGDASLKQSRKDRMAEEAAIKAQDERDKEGNEHQELETKRINAKARTWYLRPIEERMVICRKQLGEKGAGACDETWLP
jgi:hypothetical protein